MQELTRGVLIERLDKLEYTLESMRAEAGEELNEATIVPTDYYAGMAEALEGKRAQLDILLAIVRGEDD